MKNLKNKKLLLIGIALMGLTIGGLVFVNAVPQYVDDLKLTDPWGKKPVLSYFFFTAESSFEEKRENLFKVLALSEGQKESFQKIVKDEQIQISLLEENGQVLIQDDKKEKISVLQFNSRLQSTLKDTDQKIRKLLGSSYPVFRKAIRDWWKEEQERVKQLKQPKEEIGILSSAYSCYVFATQYKGYTNYEVALPDKYVKWANLGWSYRYNNPPYTVNVARSGYWVGNVLVKEVGPWNEDDNYWDSAYGYNPRRLFTDIPLCWSEAEYVYFYGYNNGRSQFGYIVTNPASVDLTPAVAVNLGLKYLQNSWLTVHYYDLP